MLILRWHTFVATTWWSSGMTLDTKYVSSRYSLLNHQSLKQYLQTIICIYTSQWSLITETLSLLRTIWHSLSQVLYQLCRSCPPLPHSLTNHSSAFSHVSHSWPITAQYHMSQGLSAFQTQPCTLLMITLLLVHHSQHHSVLESVWWNFALCFNHLILHLPLVYS